MVLDTFCVCVYKCMLFLEAARRCLGSGKKSSIFMSSDDSKTHVCQNGSQKNKCYRSLKRRKLFILIFTKMCQIYDMISGVKKSSAEIAEILGLFVRRCFDPSQQCGYLRFHLISCITLHISFLLKEKKIGIVRFSRYSLLLAWWTSVEEHYSHFCQPCRYVKDICIFSIVSLL